MEAKENVSIIEQEKLKAIADKIRKKSAEGKFTKYADIILEITDATEEGVKKAVESLKSCKDFGDIVELQGKRLKYLYSQSKMSENYAKMMFRVEENDLLRLIVETVRYESEIYPRPTALHTFLDSPFYFTEDALKEVFNQIKENTSYQDIQQTWASNGAACLYSSKYLTADYAKVLAEWIEVKQYENP